MTEARLRILSTAASRPTGLVERPLLTGFERVAWDKNVSRLIEAEFLTRYVHGGYEITPLGRVALDAAIRSRKT